MYSNSSLNCFANCMAKYKYSYIDNIEPEVVSPHLQFGSIGHKVLEDAGRLRDEANAGVVDVADTRSIIPSEILYPELKEKFNIPSWERYFKSVIRQCEMYEDDCIQALSDDYPNSDIKIERELKISTTLPASRLEIVGVIDVLLYIPHTAAIILDYKFSTGRKTQSDFDENSQLYVYAKLVHDNYDIPLRNIRVGYIDIPKQVFDQPAMLKNGTLSRAKSQNCSQEIYALAVLAAHGNDPYYNIDEGGYYHDIYLELANNKSAYLQMQYLDMEAYKYILQDMKDTAEVIENLKVFPRKFDSYSCKNCEYKNHCKPWLGVNIGEDC